MEIKKKTKDEIIICEIENFITDEECDFFIEMINSLKLHKGQIVSHNEGDTLREDVRSAKTCTLPRTKIVESLRRRVEDLCNSTPYSSEGCSAIKYEQGDFFTLHCDYFHHYNKELIERPVAMNRVKTAVIYLNDDFEGGETSFPFIDTIIKPKRGKLIAWRNGEPSGANFEESQHAGELVKSGTKYILTFWMHIGPFEDPIYEETPQVFERSKAK